MIENKNNNQTIKTNNERNVNNKSRIKKILYSLIILLFTTFLIFSYFYEYKPGNIIRKNFVSYLVEMMKILPLTFILIGLFEVWVKKETVEKHLGEKSNFLCYLWAIILGGTTIGPMLVALPIAYTLYKKGAKISVIYTYIGASSVCRIPMTIFEASFIGVKFTIVRYLVSIPLITISSILFEKTLKKGSFTMNDVEQEQ